MKIEELKKGLIVSCQATPEEPMRDSNIMARFAISAEIGGAVGVRINGVADILAVRQLVSVPIIGIIKRHYPDSSCYITPTLRDVASVCQAGADIVAVDATNLVKPGGIDAASFIGAIKEKFPEILLMADISTLEEGIDAGKAGADLVSTTLSGYTEHTKKNLTGGAMWLEPPDLELVSHLASSIDIPVVAEGRYWDERLSAEAFRRGAHNVVIGTAITRPQVITQKIVSGIQQYL